MPFVIKLRSDPGSELGIVAPDPTSSPDRVQQPHEGNLFEFLYRQPALQSPELLAV